MDRIDELRAFIAVADARSFIQGARRLSVSPAQISKLIARHEDRLGARLLNRTTRDVSLTDTGRAYLERARDLLDGFEALESSVRDLDGPRGVLRVSAPVSFGAVEMEPALLAFAAAFPQVGLDVSFSDRTVNLVDEGFDVAVRIQRLADSSLVARRLAPVRLVSVASPEHLARAGAPKTPRDLTEREVIVDTNLRDPFVWDFATGDIRVSGRLRFASATACAAAALGGFGVARAPAFVVAQALRDGRLQLLLREFEPEPVAVNAVYPHARHLAPKVRVFVDFLAQRFAGEPAWHQGWS